MSRPKGSVSPHLWKSGPDPVRHTQYVAWARMKAQADFRGEPWAMPFEDFVAAWGDRWSERGRTRNATMLARRDITQAWSLDNCELIDRSEFGRRQGQLRREKNRNAV